MIKRNKLLSTLGGIVFFITALLAVQPLMGMEYHYQRVPSVYEVLYGPITAQIVACYAAKRCSPSPELIQKISHIVNTALSGKVLYLTDSYDTISETISLPNAPVDKQASADNKNICSYVAYATFGAVKTLIHEWQASNQPIMKNEQLAYEEDLALSNSVALKVAMHIVLDKIITLMLIMYSPRAHPCDRMHSLFLLNSIHMMGTVGRMIEKYITRVNYYYFESDGLLIKYDPSKRSAQSKTKIQALVTFLLTIFPMKKGKVSPHTLTYFLRGISYGISALIEPYEMAKRGLTQHYYTSWFQHIAHILNASLGYDLNEWYSVDSVTLVKNRETRRLIKLMQILTFDTACPPSTMLQRFAHGQMIVHASKNCATHSIMKSYLADTYKRHFTYGKPQAFLADTLIPSYKTALNKETSLERFIARHKGRQAAIEYFKFAGNETPELRYLFYEIGEKWGNLMYNKQVCDKTVSEIDEFLLHYKERFCHDEKAQKAVKALRPEWFT